MTALRVFLLLALFVVPALMGPSSCEAPAAYNVYIPPDPDPQLALAADRLDGTGTDVFYVTPDRCITLDETSYSLASVRTARFDPTTGTITSAWSAPAALDPTQVCP